MFSTVVFDLDGTILNTLDDLANAGNYTLTCLSFPTHPASSYKKMVGNGIPTLIQRILPEENRNSATLHLALSIFTDYYEKHSLDCTAPYPGIIRLLQNLRISGIQLALLSNKNDAMAKKIVAHFFGGLFDEVWGLSSNYPPKPDPASLLALIKQLRAQPTSTLYCGDSNVDIMTANNADIASCGVTWGFRTAAELQNVGAHYLAHTPEDLEVIIKN